MTFSKKDIYTVDPRPLDGKTAIITGASRNLGAGIALGLAAAGANVAVHYNSVESRQEANKVALKAQDFGVQSFTIQADLTQTRNIKRIFEKVHSKFGTIDIVVNNAGAMHKSSIAKTTEKEFDDIFALNTKSTFFVMEKAAQMLADNGRIINIGTSLLAAFIGEYGLYAGSKAPIEDFTRALAKEIGHKGITVNTICPGPLDTSFLTNVESQETLDWLASASVQGRLGRVSDIVPWVIFTASPSAKWSTGQTFFVNGGFVTR